MFITLTIDTHQKKRAAVRLHQSKVNPASGWRKKFHMKKRSVWQKLKDYKRSLKQSQYSLDGQAAMF